MNFYRQVRDGALTDDLDKARTVSETLLFSSGKRNPSSFAKCAFETDFRPSHKEAFELAAAGAFLWCGSPVQVHNWAMTMLFASQIDAFNGFNSEEVTEDYKLRHGDKWKELLEKDRDDFLKGKLYVDVGREHWKQLGFDCFQLEHAIINLLLGMNMSVVDCHYKSTFISSDNPVVRTYPTTPNKLDDEVWFPVSYNRAVWWHRKKVGARVAFGRSETCAMNRRVISHAYKFVYSPTQDEWVESACRTNNTDPTWGHYGSLAEVISQARPARFADEPKDCEIIDLVAAMKAGKRHDVVGL